ncbi:MAG: hypothetical protein K2X11_08830 [Acetobacteraceae bacterium]|nr:hypothetical protein [Acetobacteraceae bacterium]
MADGPANSARMEPGTMRRALLFGVVLAAGVAGVASLGTRDRGKSPLEPYIRLGQRAGSEQLRRDLEQLSPIGADPGPAIQRLVSLGFSCTAPGLASGNWHCAVRLPQDERRVLSFEATIRVERGVVSGIEARMSQQAVR